MVVLIDGRYFFHLFFTSLPRDDLSSSSCWSFCYFLLLLAQWTLVSGRKKGFFFLFPLRLFLTLCQKKGGEIVTTGCCRQYCFLRLSQRRRCVDSAFLCKCYQTLTLIFFISWSPCVAAVQEISFEGLRIKQGKGRGGEGWNCPHLPSSSWFWLLQQEFFLPTYIFSLRVRTLSLSSHTPIKGAHFVAWRRDFGKKEWAVRTHWGFFCVCIGREHGGGCFQYFCDVLTPPRTHQSNIFVWKRHLLLFCQI